MAQPLTDGNDYLARVGSIHLLRHEIKERTKMLDRGSTALHRLLHGDKQMSGLLSLGTLRPDYEKAGWQRADEVAGEVFADVAKLRQLIEDLRHAEASFKEAYGKDVPV